VAVSLVRGRVVAYRCKHCQAHNLTDGRTIDGSSESTFTTGDGATTDDAIHVRAVELGASDLGESGDRSAARLEATPPSPLHLFLSWSGNRSRAVAAILLETLSDFVDGIEPWMSDETGSGSFWSAATSDRREGARFGIICVTPENQHSTWLNFEAGAFVRLFRDARAVPYLLDLLPSNLKPPLGLLQAKPSTEAGTWDMVRSINRAVAAPLPEDGLRRRFDAFWPQLAQKLAEVPPPETRVETARPGAELLGEILDRVRGVEAYLNSQLASSSLSDQIWDVCQLVLQEIRDTSPGEKKVQTLPGIPMPAQAAAPAPRPQPEPAHEDPTPDKNVVFDYDDDERTGVHSSTPPPVATTDSTTIALERSEPMIPIDVFSGEAAPADRPLDDVPPPTSG